ncbi:MAG: LysR substrate-binding domain-containing protein [Nakamurella sp.]
MAYSRLLDGRLTVRHLVLVDTLTEHGSIVGAAAALHVTQPVLSRRLRDLEETLGVPLYDRGPRGVSPTEFGLAFTDHARAVLAQLMQATRHIEEISDAERGEVVVGTHLAGSNLLLPRAIAELKREHSRLTVVVRERTPEALLVELSSGRVDLIVGRLGHAAPDTVRQQALYDEGIRLVVGENHPLVGQMADQTEADLAAVLSYPWILPGPETSLRRELESFFARQGYDLPSNGVEATSYLTVRQLLIETDMVAALPSLIGTDDPRLRVLPVSLEPMGHRVGITVVSDRRLNPASLAMIEALKRVADAIAMY